jgi:hypothetical protein
MVVTMVMVMCGMMSIMFTASAQVLMAVGMIAKEKKTISWVACFRVARRATTALGILHPTPFGDRALWCP